MVGLQELNCAVPLYKKKLTFIKLFIKIVCTWIYNISRSSISVKTPATVSCQRSSIKSQSSSSIKSKASLSIPNGSLKVYFESQFYNFKYRLYLITKIYFQASYNIKDCLKECQYCLSKSDLYFCIHCRDDKIPEKKNKMYKKVSLKVSTIK